MKINLFVKLSILLICTAATSSCSNNQNSDTLKIVDCSGATVTINKDVSKIICVDQSCCAFLTAMNQTSKIIGVHGSVKFSNWSPIFLGEELDHMKKYGYQPSAEAIYESGADLVILNDAKYAEELRKAQIPAIYFGYANIDGLYKAVDMLGKIFGNEATSFVQKWKTRIDNTQEAIKSDLKTLEEEGKRNVYYINASNNPSDLYSTFGGNSFCEYLMNSIGANLITSQYKDITSIESEIIIGKNPDAIIIGGYAEYAREEELKSSDLWKDVDAVKNDAIYLLPTSFVGFEKFSVELPLLLDFTANALYPALHEFGGKAALDSFIKEYYGLELTDDILNNMLLGLYPDGSRMDQ